MDRKLGEVITPLVRYIYENIKSSKTPRGTETNLMRVLVALFCAHHSRYIHGTAFFNLLREGGDFVEDYHKMMQHNLDFKEYTIGSSQK